MAPEPLGIVPPLQAAAPAEKKHKVRAYWDYCIHGCPFPCQHPRYLPQGMPGTFPNEYKPPEKEVVEKVIVDDTALKLLQDEIEKLRKMEADRLQKEAEAKEAAARAAEVQKYVDAADSAKKEIEKLEKAKAEEAEKVAKLEAERVAHEAAIKGLEKAVKDHAEYLEVRNRHIHVLWNSPSADFVKNWTFPISKVSVWEDFLRVLMEALPGAVQQLRSGMFELRRLTDNANILPSMWEDHIVPDGKYEIIVFPLPPPPRPLTPPTPISYELPSRAAPAPRSFKAWFAEVDKRMG
ncbi:uncharacterized protein V1510DRAFT_417784 [Dipodascopsis tothii]|uniref:uncharacterized protein n=1 Tax=Dipodascopsis tothii TaxID=44089 RepID=UPI0034CE4270